MSYKRVKEWRRHNKEKLIQAFGGKCAVCGLVDHSSVYDFHHLDPSAKDFVISNGIKTWDKLAEEARKCVLLCCVCHRKLHAGICQLPEHIQRFDENLIISVKNDFYDSCPVCGTQKLKSQLTCSHACGAKRQYRVNWESIDLKTLFKEKGSYLGVARELGISDVAVKKRMRKMGLI